MAVARIAQLQMRVAQRREAPNTALPSIRVHSTWQSGRRLGRRYSLIDVGLSLVAVVAWPLAAVAFKLSFVQRIGSKGSVAARRADKRQPRCREA